MRADHPNTAMPWGNALLLGFGTLAIGAVAPLYDAFVPAMLERHLHGSIWVGAVMGIDNALAMLLVPLCGVLSDQVHTRLGRRMPFVLASLPIAAIALALLPIAEMRGFLPLLLSIVVLNLALAVWRAPFSALIAELIPSAHRSKVGGLSSLAMCLGAMVVLGSAGALHARDPRLPFAFAASLVFLVWLVHAALLREPRSHAPAVPLELTLSPLRALRGAFAGGDGLAPRFFAGCAMFHMAFQSLSSWFTTHTAERFGISIADASVGFIAIAIATLVGSLPAGWLGVRYGRRRIALVGLAGMIVACVALHFAPSAPIAIGLLGGFGLFWSLPLSNLLPMALELAPPERAGSLAAAYLLCQSAAGVVGPALVGSWFDISGGKRSLFLVLALFLAGSVLLLRSLRAGFGEAQFAGAALPSQYAR